MIKTIVAVACIVGLSSTAHALETLEIASPVNGEKIHAIAAGESDANYAVLVVHDYFGLSQATVDEIERLAQNGYRTVAVDLYDGEAAETDEQATVLMNALDQDAAQEHVAAAYQYLSKGGRPVAIVGYSMGASIALKAAAHTDNMFGAVAAIYGGGYQDLSDDELSKMPSTLIVSGSADGWSYQELLTLQERMHALGNPAQTLVYPNAGHGYAQPQFIQGANLHPGAMAATRAVLDLHLMNLE